MRVSGNDTRVELVSGEARGSLQQLTDAALAYLPQDELLTELLERVAGILRSDTAAFLLLDDEGRFLHARAAKGIEEEVEQGVRIPVGGGFAGRIAAFRRAITIDDVDHADILNPILREKGIRSLLGVPLLIEGRVIGVLHVGSLTPRRFTDEDRDLLQLVADRAALAIDRAELFRQERAARQEAEAATQRLQSLLRVTDAALAYLPQDELLRELLERVAEVLRSDTAAFLLLDDEGRFLHARAAKGIEEEVEQGVRIPVGGGFAGRIAAFRRAITIDDVDHADILNPILREKGIRSLLGVPLLIEGRVIGVLHVGSLVPRRFTDEDRDLLQLVADRAALAIEHAALYEQRRLAVALQHELLPDLRAVPGVELASRYLPASEEALGGDWFDAFPLPGGRVALVVGDVVGHGVGAAVIMAQLRTTLRAYAADGATPAEVVERMNLLMWQLGPRAMTTLAYVVIDPPRHTLELVNAGHPPPLAVAADGASFLDGTVNVPLAVAPAARYESSFHRYDDGTTLVLYTDGLVERRGETIDTGLERLRLAAPVGGDAETTCTRIVSALVPEKRRDDVALIALRVPPPPAALAGAWPADRRRLVEIRQQLRVWLEAQGAEEEDVYDITVACQEACANAIEHAYGPGPASFTLDATCEGGVVRLTIRDDGRWRPPRGTHRGRGLPLMRALMDGVEVDHHDAGTRVVLERALARVRA
jgi:GAF domain-containing protein/anti-sigma regulatory factor (Ser/Thr protein kinase)